MAVPLPEQLLIEEPIMSEIIKFFDHPLFTVIGGITVISGLLAVIYRIVCWAFGITPIVFRLGMAIWKRKVAIFADDDMYGRLKDTLIDSRIFKDKNIVHIRKDNIEKAKGVTIFLVDWETYKDQIEQVFGARKNDQTAIVIYARPASIPKKKMNDIANRENTVVVNFRGRLLNDILTSLITTSYERKQ